MYIIKRLMEVLRDQTGHTETYLPDVMTISIQDKSDRHAAVTDPEVNTFHRAIASIVVLAQCFGLLPVHGVTAPSAQSLRFRWASARVVYTAFVLCLLLFMVLFCSLYTLQIGGSFQDAQCMIFYGIGTATYAMFLEIARRWPRLMVQWSTVEQKQSCYGPSRRLRLKIRCITAMILSGAAVEHLLNEYNNLKFAAQQANTTTSIIRQYMLKSHHHLFNYVGYSHACAAVATMAGALATFSWNYMDLFISITSIALAERFRLLNRHLQNVRGKTLPGQIWKQIREHYTSLMDLTDTLNLCISHMVLLSFGSNLYFICLQLFNTLGRLAKWYERVYFYWSFGFLILRTVTMSLSVASINDESHLPRSVLFAVPARGYNVEVSRFLQLVTTCEVALTGLNFFSVTRTMLLTMAGTIVTYEIVLVQFSHNDS
ncbi:gustatory receptor for sugar taste 64f [Cryptotermes secundus]|uniref:gustatory receptor for sugar taste 64f n=1 Tax=Cryptotermes secundus TaxID=105785 RepID=UPI000CD7B7E8|nr:gustatory receptor for sugar taste 64f [Cryptotermes secundus]